jgi:4-hydroxy-L-threonine phosphate dehydrogenase PdxA
MTTKKTLNLAITPGAEDGVGPELLLTALSQLKNRDFLNYFWCGDLRSLRIAIERTGIVITFSDTKRAQINGGPTLYFFDDIPTLSLLERQAQFLQKSVELATKKVVDAIVTGPIDKACLMYLDDNLHKGQTEFFAMHLAKNNEQPFMAFVGGPFLLSLLTTHLPLKEVSCALTINSVINHIKAVAHHAAMILNKNIKDIKIAILAFNPHAGEGGMFGQEEIEILLPAIKTVLTMGLKVYGPLPADGFFAYFTNLTPKEIPDVVVATYHDQGLIPYKLLAQGSAVNVTLGLTVPRTSPAHGTAQNLAGKNLACPKSTKAAIITAIELAYHI